MKVYFVTGEPFPNGMAATNRIKCYAKALKEGGVECEIVVFKRTEVYGKTPKNILGMGLYDGIPFRYIGGTPLRGKHMFIRQINDRFDVIRTDKYLFQHLAKGDVLFLYIGGHIDLVMRFMKVAHKRRAYCVRDLCELPYGTVKETEKTIRLRKRLIEQQFPLLDGIISISDSLLNMAKSYTLPSCKHIKIPIMVEYEHFGIAEKPKSFSIPFIFHAGTLYQQKDGYLGMIEAFGRAKQKLNKPLKYILTGSINSSSHPDELQHLIEKYQIEDSVEFVGYLNRDQIKEFLMYASLVISNRPRSKQDYYGFSTKVGEYLASGTPLLMTNWGEAANWLENGKSAIVTEPENIEELADAIVYVFSHPEESRQIGLVGQEVCRKHFDYHNWSRQLVEFMFLLGK